MAIKTSKYFLGSTGANYSIFDLEYALINYSENEISFKGGAAVDNVYVGNGFTFDFTESQGAIDKLYLKGASSDFNFAYDSQADVLTLTHKTVAGTIIRVSPDDTILFTDGSISALDITTHLPATGANLATNLLNSAERSPTNPNDLLVAQVSNNTLNAFALNGNGVTFAQVDPGVQLIVKGGNGVDLVYVSAGSQVTASDLGGGEDKIFLTGNWADYTKTYDSQADTVTLARTINGNTEQVIVAVGDRLVFADGYVSTDAAIAYAQNSVANPVTLNATETTPGLAITPAQLAALSDAQLAALTPAELAPLTAAHLDALTPAQITALGADAASLNPDTLASLDAAQVAALAPAAIAALSNEQLAALTPAQIAGLTPAQVDSLSPAQVGAIGSDIASLTPTAAASLDAAQQAAVLPANPAALSDAQLAALTPAQVTGLTAAQIDALTPAQITALGADAASLAPAALASLDAAQIAALTPAAIAALSNEQLAALTPAQVAGITAAQIDALSPAQIGAIGTDIASLTPAASASLDAAQQAAVLPAAPATLSDAQLAALTPAQIAGITAAQIDTLTPAQVTALGADAASLTPTALASLDAAQVAALTPAALAALSNDQLAALTPAQIAGITAAQIDALSPAQIGAIGSDISALNTAAAASLDAAQQAAIVPANPAALTDAQLAALSPAQVTGLTAAQIDTLTPAQITALGADAGSLAPAALASLDAAQIAALAPAAVAGLSDAKLAALTPAQVAAITAAQIDALTPAQVAALGSDLPSLSTAALASVDAAQIAAVAPATLAALSDAQLAALTPAQVAGLTAAQIDALTPAQVTALGADATSLSTAALASLDAAQVAALAPATVAALSDAQLAALTPAQVAGLTAAQIDALTPAQVAALGSDLPSLSPAALASVDAAQIAAVAPATVAALSDAQLAALTPAQVAGLTAAQIDALSPAQVTALGIDAASLSTAAQASLDAPQVAALAPATLAALDNTELAALTPAQLANVTATQIDALTPAQITALGADVNALPVAALASFDAAQVAAITPLSTLSDAQLTALTAAQLANVTAAQIDSLTPAQITALGADVTALPVAALASFDAAQVAAITPLSALTDAQLTALTPAQLANVTATQIDALSPAQITALGADVNALPVAALASFDAAQVAAITPLSALTDAQLTALTAAQLANVTAAQIDSLTPAQVAALGIDAASLSTAAQASLDAAQVAALAPATLAALDNTELAALTPAQLANVTATQIDALTPAQITALGADVTALPVAALASFDAAQVAAITPLSALSDAQLAALTPAQLANVSATQIDGLSAAQVTALGADLSSLPTAAIASIDATQAAGITATQLDTFDATDLGALTPAAIGALTPAALASLDAAQFANLTPTQVAQITGTQVDALSPAQIAALTVGQAAALNAGALASLDAAQQAALTIVANAVTVDPVAHTISGTLSTALAIGETVKVSLDGGTTWVNATATAGQTTFNLANAGIDASNKAIQVKVVDTLNNSGAVFSEAQFGETLINTTTAGSQGHSNQNSAQVTGITAGANKGGYVIVWEGVAAGDADGGNYAQLYNAAGQKVGGETLVNTFTTGNQSAAAVAALSDGGFVVTWRAMGQDTADSWGIYAQRFNASGVAVGTETLVNTTLPTHDLNSQVIALADGGYVIGWRNDISSASDVAMQRYDASGTRIGGETLVNAYAGGQSFIEGCALADGGWVMLWADNGPGDSVGIFTQRYAASGVTVGGPVLVNTTTAENQTSGSITGLADGGYVVHWNSNLQDGSGQGAYSQRYDANGLKVGAETLVNTSTTSNQYSQDNIALADGGWVATWLSSHGDGTTYDVYQQRYNADGSKSGSETLVNSTTALDQTSVSAASLTDGGWIVSWSGNGTQTGNADSDGVFSQRYAADGSKFGPVTLTGTAAADVITTGAGDQTLNAGLGNDILNGGAGNDTAVFSGNKSAYTITDNGNGTITVAGPDGTDTLSGIENLQFADVTRNLADALSGAKPVAEMITVNPADTSISGTLNNALASGEKVQVRINGGTWTDATSTGNTFTASKSANTADEKIEVRVTDASGNNAGGVFSETQYGEVGVSTVAGSTQAASKVSGLADGGWVTVWFDNRNDTHFDIYMQRYDASGNPLLAANGVVVAATAQEQHQARVTGLVDGGWVVTFVDKRSGDWNIYQQRFDAQGNAKLAVNGEAVVNMSGQIHISESVTALADGGWLVTWMDSRNNTNSASDFYDIYMQRYSADGSAMLVANGMAVTTVSGNELSSGTAVTALSNGGWVVTWESQPITPSTSDTSGSAVMAKVYDVAGNVVKAEYLVNTHTSGNQNAASVGALGNGGYIVTWTSVAQDSSGDGVYFQRYDALGNKQGSETLVNTTTADNQNSARVVALAKGGFVITWGSYAQDGAEGGIYLQRYDNDGTRVGQETLVNSTTAFGQGNQHVSALVDGGYVITWESTQVDGSTYNIYQQRYAADGSKFGPVTLTGTAAADVITTGAGDQTLNAGLGNDILNGGAGNDTAVFSGNKSAYTITDNGNGTITVAGPDGTDTLSGIENLQFADVTRNLADALSGAKPVAEMITVNPADTSISGTLNNALASGEKVQVRINGGTWTDATSTGNTFTASKSANTADEKIEVRVTDASGNNAGGVFSETQYGEVGVSTVAGSTQAASKVSGLADGGWVTVWFDNRNDTHFDIYMQRYDASGNPLLAANGVVVAATAQEQHQARVTGLVDGGWVVTFVDKRSGDWNIYQQRFDAQGNAKLAVNGEAVVNMSGQIHISESVTALADGGWLVTWMDSRNNTNSASDFYDIYMQRYSADGSAMLVANGMAVTTVSGNELSSGTAVTALSNGGWVVTWESQPITPSTSDTSGSAVMAKVYDVAGNVVKAEYLVNTHTSGNQNAASVGALGNGGYIVTWTSVAQDSSGDGVYFQRYDALGNKQGSETLVNTTTADNQNSARVVALAKGGFVITWGSYAQDGAEGGIYLQRYDNDGTRVGQETLVNSTTAFGQGNQHVSALVDGGYVITWESTQVDGSTYNIYQQRYAADGSKLGDVTLTGSAGNDALTGNYADNNFTTSAGTDTIDGGANGNNGDTLTAGTTGPVAIDLTGKNAGTVTDGANVTTFTNVENLTGTSSNADSIKPAAGHNVELSNIGTLSSIEKIDLTADGANTASLTAADVAEMSKAGIVASGANGWSTNPAISTTRDQVIVEGTNVDTLNLAGNWSNAGTITNAGNTYTLYNSRDAGSTAQLIVDADVAVNGNIVADSISLGAGKGYLVAPISFTDGTGAQQTWYVWSDNADGQANTIGYAGSTITDLVDDLGFVFNADVNDYANETAPQTVTINGVTLALGRITNQVHSIDRTPDYEWNTFVQYADGDGNAATRLDRFTLPKLDGWMVDPTAQYVGYYTSQTNAENAAKEYLAGFYPTYNTSGGSAIDSIVPTSTGVMAAFQVTGTGVTTGVPTINPIATDNTITAAEMAVGVTITGTVAAGTTSVNVNFAGTNHAATLNGTTYTYTLQPADLTAMGTGSEIIAVRTNTGATATREITLGEVASHNPVQLGTAAYLGAAGSTTGSSISFAGDINGDGYEDFIVGAKSANSNAGAAYVVYGNANGIGASLTDGTIDSSKGFKITGPAASNLGLSVSGGGDFNGDGFSDMLVGTDGARNAYVVYGSATPTAVDLSAGTIASNQGYKIIGGAGSTLGVSLATSGDINGDGMDDMVVADVGSASNSWTGAVYVVYGSQTGATLDLSSGTINSSQGFKVTGGTGEYSVNAAGDVNGDGIADLIVGATGKGNVYVVYGTANNSGIDVSATTIPAGKGFTIDGIGTLGYSVAGVGDVNGDGYSDLAIGSYNNNSYTGVGYVVYGSANGTTVDLTSGNIAPAQGFQVNTGLARSTLGRQVSAAGDVNGDGLADVIISAPDSFGSYVVYGSSTTSNLVLGSDGSIDSSRGFRLTGDYLSYTGWRVDGGGDLNGDGLDDLLITAAGTNSWAGGYNIVLGGQQFATTVDYLGDATANTLTGTATAETFVAGDGNDTLTGNGGADVMLGGKGNDTFTLNASNITALQSAMGAGGNTTQLATVDGGTGIDTLRVTGGANLDLTAISNTMEGSRIESVEKIDLSTDTAANTLKIKVSDVLDMSEMNVFNNSTLGGTTLGASVAKHQVLVDASAGDVVQINTTGWTTSSNVVANGHTYDIYNYGTSAAQLLIDHNATVQQVL
jgi:hypothetical protein